MNWYELPNTLKIGSAVEILNVDHSDHDQVELTGELWQRLETLVLLLEGDRAMVDADGRLALLSTQEIEHSIGEQVAKNRIQLYLGRVFESEGIPDDGISVAGFEPQTQDAKRVPVLAIMLEPSETEKFSIGEWLSLRSVADTLNPLDAGLLTRAVALANWHKAHQFSPRTGHRTNEAKGGWVRVDDADGSEHFPRTDPAIIVAVTDASERLLLASNMAWNERVFSLIAGFVDPGESLEQAVLREVKEESGLTVSEPRYLGSQPWPFPASLMLGFSALAKEGESTEPDGVEIRELRWFTRDELKSAIISGEILVPGGGSISRAIIEAWYGKELPGQRD
ncbi:MAG TPA: NAD(+) diphosphatase [Microbacteriaceae bacterium]|nr:NAD(+) diphosphatase [Microbacteriaceae bacterium]